MGVQKHFVATIRYVSLVVARLLNYVFISSLAVSVEVNSAIIAVKLARYMRGVINDFEAGICYVNEPVTNVLPR
jgi:hypothetical protein